MAKVLALLIAGCGVLGLAIGSFLNVVIYRVPRNESIVSPRSHCPRCGAILHERDNIPVVSWLLLRGRCRTCHEPISVQYPLVELACATLFAGAAARLGVSWTLPAILALLAGLLAVSVVDVERLIIPKRIVYPTLIGVAGLLAMAAGATGDWRDLTVAAACAAGWFVLFFLINLASPRALGFGDVRLSLLLGLGLGWFGVPYVLIGFFAANLIGACTGLILIATKKVSRRQPVPYGVFLSLGTIIALYAGPELISWFDSIR